MKCEECTKSTAGICMMHLLETNGVKFNSTRIAFDEITREDEERFYRKVLGNK